MGRGLSRFNRDNLKSSFGGMLQSYRSPEFDFRLLRVSRVLAVMDYVKYHAGAKIPFILIGTKHPGNDKNNELCNGKKNNLHRTFIY